MTSLVLFGGTGDLCKKKLIPALYHLHQKSMLPTDLKIIGAARRDRNTETWLKSLGDYPTDFAALARITDAIYLTLILYGHCR